MAIQVSPPEYPKGILPTPWLSYILELSNICHEEFNVKKTIVNHIETHHFKEVECKKCHKKFRMVDLAKHMESCPSNDLVSSINDHLEKQSNIQKESNLMN